ncbi:MAG: hypothetical protein M3R71_04195, partial [Actinomycetota bacterium]|nr:hypothetical protein [Actinomycetota bacterium]
VAAVAIAAVVVAAALISSASRGTARSSGAVYPPVAITGVSVFMVNNRPPDDPSGTRYVFDGNPNTTWDTAPYGSPDFGGLYPGIGLAIELPSLRRVHQLEVTSPTAGWSAQAYTAKASIPSPSPLAAWGAPVTTQSGVGSGTTVFDLGDRSAGWVLLWLTNLGAARQVKIAEVTLR